MTRETNIVKEIDSLAEYVKNLNFARIHKQAIPSKYKHNELSIRFIDGESTSETGYHYRLDREYQFVYFGESEKSCIEIASKLERKFNDVEVLRLLDSTRHLRIGSFSMSPTFRTENKEVFAFIGVLKANVRQARTFEEAPKMEVIEIEKQE